MRCEVVERELSARLDGAPDRRLDAAVERHVGTCGRCRAFVERSEGVRELVRIEPAVPVPDLVPPIMRRVREEARSARPIVLPRAPAWGRYAAAFAAGAVAALLVVGGLPALRRGPPPALAAEIPRRIAAASGRIASYRATFAIVEHGFHPAVPRRTFTAEIAFRAPERFRASITDRTRYPSDAWPRNDVVLAVDEGRWMLDAPRGCPREALPACAPVGRDVRLLRGRPPFDGDAPLPTDIILPVHTLAGSERVRVLREGEVLGRDAATIELAYRDATPLFAYLQQAGVWRPFFPHDRVVMSLDTETWFPLGYEVRASASAERPTWAMHNGLSNEPAGALLFAARARSLSDGPPPSWSPYLAPGPARDLGFVARPFADVAGAGFAPSELLGLRPHRAGAIGEELVLSYADGLSWLVVRATRGWSGPTLFGDVGPLARRTELGERSIGYYEPATVTLGRRLSVHARGWDVFLETNLSREALVDIARSLPVEGLTVPLGRGTLGEARTAAPFLLLPTELPPGYEAWAVDVGVAGERPSTGAAVTIHFRRAGAELDGGGILLYQARGIGLPPPMEPEVLAVRVRGVPGRYSPLRGELEWVEGDVYRSLGGTALDLAGLLRVADSMEPPG